MNNKVFKMIMNGNKEYNHAIHYITLYLKIFGDIPVSYDLSKEVNENCGWYD